MATVSLSRFRTVLPIDDLEPNRLLDRFGRVIPDLRLSVTDRCNHRCVYCLTESEVPSSSELSIEDDLRMSRSFVSPGIIAPVSRPFCGHSSRIRITSNDKLRTCLLSQSDHDLYSKMLRGGTDEARRTYIGETVFQKEERHHIGEPGFEKPLCKMVHIGG